MKRTFSPIIKLGEHKLGTWRIVSKRVHLSAKERVLGQITIESSELAEYVGKSLFLVIYTKQPEIKLCEPEKEAKK